MQNILETSPRKMNLVISRVVSFVLIAGSTFSPALAGSRSAMPSQRDAGSQHGMTEKKGSPASSSSVAAVQAIPLTSGTQGNPARRKPKYDVVVGPNGWQATDVQVRAGDRIHFRASGQMTMSNGHVVKPSGVARGWTDLLRSYPLSSANSGALIGRIGNQKAALPFLVGADRDWTAPSGGQLYLRANLSPDLKAQGRFKVEIRLQAARGIVGSSAEEARSFVSRLSPDLFAKIPRRVQDRHHHLGDMVNFALVGSEQQVKNDLAAAGWFPTDANPEYAFFHGLIRTLSRQPYTQVPMSTLYLFGRPQDLAYARAHAIKVAATRDHMRLWKTTETVNGMPLWVGAATHDNGFESDQRDGGVTHHIDPQIDQERDFILNSLQDAGQVQAAAYVLPSQPVHQGHTATGGSFTSDGRILVLLLK